MEATVRYIPIDTAVVDGQPISVGNKPALCFRGKESAVGVINSETEITVVKLSLLEHDHSKIVLYGHEEYPVPRIIGHFKRIMAEKAITPEAKRLIESWPDLPEDFGAKPTPVPVQPKKEKKEKVANCIPELAKEHQTTPSKVRKFLRAQGMRAPYENEKEIRKLMKSYKE